MGFFRGNNHQVWLSTSSLLTKIYNSTNQNAHTGVASEKTLSSHLKSYTHIFVENEKFLQFPLWKSVDVIWMASSSFFFFFIGIMKSLRMKCIRFYRGNISLVKDFYCKGATKPRQEERVCNVNPCPIWYVFQSLRMAFVFTTFIFFSFIHALKNRY